MHPAIRNTPAACSCHSSAVTVYGFAMAAALWSLIVASTAICLG